MLQYIASIKKSYYLHSTNGNEAGGKTKTMSNYIFLTENFNEGPTTYYAISADKIETLKLSETYDKHGQTVGHTNAGDYSVENSASDAKPDCEKAIEEKFNLNSVVIDGDKVYSIDSEEVDYSFDDDSDFQKLVININDFIEEWRKENEAQEEVKGFTYWDGHNWKTVTTSANIGETSHSVIDDEKLIAELNAAIENKSFENSGFGCEVFTHNEWVIIDSNWQGTWSAFEIMSMEDYEYLQPNSSALPAIH